MLPRLWMSVNMYMCIQKHHPYPSQFFAVHNQYESEPDEPSDLLQAAGAQLTTPPRMTQGLVGFSHRVEISHIWDRLIICDVFLVIRLLLLATLNRNRTLSVKHTIFTKTSAGAGTFFTARLRTFASVASSDPVAI